MKILQLVTVRQRRGAEVFATQLSDALVRRGNEVLLAGLFPAPPDPISPEVAGVCDLRSASNVRFDPARLMELSQLIRRFRPQLVQANGSQTLKYSSLARRIVGPRFPLVYRNISVASHWVRNPAQRLLGQWFSGAVDHVASVSEETSVDFGRTYRVGAERRSVIRRGIMIPGRVEAIAARRQLRELARLPLDARVLLHTGNYSEEKNHGWLIETFQQVLGAEPSAHLVLIGDGPLRGEIEKKISTMGLGSSVHPLGLRRDAAELVAGADVFVLPSRIEGVPGVVLEAAAQEVPSVATRVGGMPEAIDDGRTGLLICPGDRDAFAAAVLKLLANDAMRHEMGKAARALVSERFSMDATAAAFEELYARLAHGRYA